MEFDYLSATEAEILGRAQGLRYMTLGEVGAVFRDVDGAHGRGEVGLAIEGFFGIPPNARSEADFPGAGIELKVVPMRRTGRGLGIKERTVVSMIDYHHLVVESWGTAKVRSKLHILFVFFEDLLDQPKGRFPVRDVVLWHPDDRINGFLRADWERVQTKVRHGLAHELSESDGRIMGPCTKAIDSHHLRSQPFGGTPSKPRAFALKPSFTFQIYQEAQRRQPAIESLRVSDPAGFEQTLLSRFAPFVGMTVDDVARQLGVAPSDSKSYAALVARRIFGAKSFRRRIAEFVEMGLTERVVRVDDRRMPYESLSFPAFRYRELVAESWEDSDLLSRVEYMLLLPVYGERRDTPQGDCVFREPVFWRPSAGDIDLIHREWEIYRLEIEAGRADQLTPASRTTAIHVRPHSLRKTDTDEAPIVGQVVKKSFWLNKPFVADILSGRR